MSIPGDVTYYVITVNRSHIYSIVYEVLGSVLLKHLRTRTCTQLLWI